MLTFFTKLQTASIFLILVCNITILTSQNNALAFDGVDEYISTTYDGVLNNGNRTIEAWVKVPTGIAATQYIITDYGEFNSPNGRRFTLNILNYKLRVEIRGWGLNGTTNLNDNMWHHVAVTYDNGKNFVSLFVDGVLEASDSPTITVNTLTTTNFQMGARIDVANFFIGEMDEVRFWDVTRSGAQILATKNTELTGTEPNLTAYYNFNAAAIGPGGVPDISTGAHPGTLINFETTDIIPSTAPITALPIDLLSFEGKIVDYSDVQLQWQTASELDNAFFEIHRSSKQNAEWEKIAKIEGSATHFGLQTYAFVDKNPAAGMNYYRLRQVDFSGKSSQSKIIALDVRSEDRSASRSPYPNPTNDLFYFPNNNLVGQVELYSFDGRLIQQIMTQGETILQIDLSTYPKGLYLLKSDTELFEIEKQ